MLDIGWSELLVIATVMIVVVGPKDLPKMLRAFGKATSRMRATANEFRRQFDEALNEAELDDVKNLVDEARKLDPRSKLTKVFDPIRSAGEDLRAELQSTSSMSPVDQLKPAEVSTPVEADGTHVPAQVEQTPSIKPSASPTSSTDKTVGSADMDAVSDALAAKTAPAKASKPAATKKVVSPAKPAATKSTVSAKKTSKKTTKKTGSEA